MIPEQNPRPDGPAGDAARARRRGWGPGTLIARPRPAYAQGLAAITAAGALLRLAFLARQSIGYDEDFTAVVVHQPLGRMIDMVGHDSAPPLFYVLTRIVTALADVAGMAALGGPGGPVALRLVPAVAGIALIPLIATLTRRIGGDSAALWAAAFTAFVPSTVMLSGFARMYGLAAALTVAAALLMWRAVERPSLARWAAYAGIAAAAVWTHYFSAVALAGMLMAGVWLRPSRRVAASAFAATAAAIASIAPWLIVATAQLEHTGQGFWIEPLSPSLVAGTLAQLIAGPRAGTDPPPPPALVALQGVAIAAAAVVAVAAAVSWRRLTPESRRAAVFCVLAASGVGLLAIVSIWRPLLEARYATLMWLPLLALSGTALAAVPKKLAVVLVVAVAVPSLALSAVPTHAATSALVPELNASIGPHDLVAADQNHYMILLDQGSDALRDRLHVLAASDPPWFAGTAAYAPGAVIHSVPDDVAANGGEVLWIADPGASPPSLPAGYLPTTTRCLQDACLTIYAPGR